MHLIGSFDTVQSSPSESLQINIPSSNFASNVVYEMNSDGILTAILHLFVYVVSYICLFFSGVCAYVYAANIFSLSSFFFLSLFITFFSLCREFLLLGAIALLQYLHFQE